MMADQRSLRSLDARCSEHARLARDHPGIEQQEIDRPTSLDELGERGLNAGRRVQIQLQRRENMCLGLSRELSGRFLDPGQAATGDDDLAAVLSGEHAGCRITEPGGGAGDESDRMSHGWFLGAEAGEAVLRGGPTLAIGQFTYQPGCGTAPGPTSPCSWAKRAAALRVETPILSYTCWR